MVSQFCVRPISKMWFLKIVQVTMKMIHLMPCRDPCRLHNHLAFTSSLRWSLKRSVKRTWTGSAFSTNESAWSVTVTGLQSRVWSGPEWRFLLLLGLLRRRAAALVQRAGGSTWGLLNPAQGNIIATLDHVATPAPRYPPRPPLLASPFPRTLQSIRRKGQINLPLTCLRAQIAAAWELAASASTAPATSWPLPARPPAPISFFLSLLLSPSRSLSLSLSLSLSF